MKDLSSLEDSVNGLASQLCKLRLEVNLSAVGVKEWYDDKDDKVLFYTHWFTQYLHLGKLCLILFHVELNTVLVPP